MARLYRKSQENVPCSAEKKAAELFSYAAEGKSADAQTTGGGMKLKIAQERRSLSEVFWHVQTRTFFFCFPIAATPIPLFGKSLSGVPRKCGKRATSWREAVRDLSLFR
jgi:hypothetical protein